MLKPFDDEDDENTMNEFNKVHPDLYGAVRERYKEFQRKRMNYFLRRKKKKISITI